MKKIIILLPVIMTVTLFSIIFFAAMMVAPLASNSSAAATVDIVPSSQATGDIPPLMLEQYQRAAGYCPGLSWTYLAAIGKKESNHGSFAGATVAADGEVTPWIIGLRLDGGGSGRLKVARILDTDDGRWDRDTAFDRAVGPMQFIPGTWLSYGADASGDGIASPHNYYDAVAGTARYLCRLGGTTNIRRALFGYNPAWWYVNDVEAIANSYSQVVQPPETPEGPSAYSLPVNRAQVSLATLSEPHWDNTPAADLPLPTGTPVYAVTAGQVIAVTASGNCGNGVVMLGSDGYKYTYCHASVTKVSTGQPVASGQQIMLSGNSGHSFGPHLHFQISTAVGVKICPQPLLVAWYEGKDVRPSPQPTAARCGYP